jgi:hypothetical protein
MSETPDGLKRPTRPPPAQQTLFEVEPNWREHWWGMPLFEMEDCRPVYQITVNFMTREDLVEFERRLEIKVYMPRMSAWYPAQSFDKPQQWSYVDET